ncbi:MAG: flavodoxin domain-containing protein, partial [Anaerolineales bacterium]|nr:flavodoxin domain-containing protein [Anaerolineales bacterium]
MKAIVIFESLYGNTVAIARAIAEGLGNGAQALSTADVSIEEIEGADLIVAGAPVHSLSLPTEKSREWARTGNMGPGGAAPDLSHPTMRSWLEKLPGGKGYSA